MKARAKDKAAELAHRVKGQAGQAEAPAAAVRQHRAPLAVATGVLIVGFLMIWWWRKR